MYLYKIKTLVVIQTKQGHLNLAEENDYFTINANLSLDRQCLHIYTHNEKIDKNMNVIFTIRLENDLQCFGIPTANFALIFKIQSQYIR